MVAVELASAQTPLLTTALNCVVAVNAPEVYVVDVFEIVVHVVNGDTELSHRTIEPV